MGRKKMEEAMNDIELDITEPEMTKVEFNDNEEKPVEKVVRKKENTDERQLVNCLRNERVIIKHINNGFFGITDKRHALFGGMAETSKRIFSVPKLTSGLYVNILTDDEKNYLEYILNLEENALSIYKKHDNFWSDANDNGINKVILYKYDNYLDLSNPEDYIRYKILLANKDLICPSIKELEEHPKKSYQFVILEEGTESKRDELNVSNKQQCYMEFGKITDDKERMAMIVEILENKPVSLNSEISWLKVKIDDAINENPAKTLKVLQDKSLDSKILLKKAITAGIVVQKGVYLYLKETNEPLCNDGEEPLFNTAAAYLTQPRQQQLKLSLEADLKGIRR